MFKNDLNRSISLSFILVFSLSLSLIRLIYIYISNYPNYFHLFLDCDEQNKFLQFLFSPSTFCVLFTHLSETQQEDLKMNVPKKTQR